MELQRRLRRVAGVSNLEGVYSAWCCGSLLFAAASLGEILRAVLYVLGRKTRGRLRLWLVLALVGVDMEYGEVARMTHGDVGRIQQVEFTLKRGLPVFVGLLGLFGLFFSAAAPRIAVCIRLGPVPCWEVQ